MSLVILRLCLRNPSFVPTKTNFQGSEAIRTAQLDAIKSALFKIPGTKFFLPEDSPDYSYLRSRVNIYCGKPDLRELEYPHLNILMTDGSTGCPTELIFSLPPSPLSQEKTPARNSTCAKSAVTNTVSTFSRPTSLECARCTISPV